MGPCIHPLLWHLPAVVPYYASCVPYYASNFQSHNMLFSDLISSEVERNRLSNQILTLDSEIDSQKGIVQN